MHQAKIVLLVLCFRELQKMPMRRASRLVVKQFQLKGGAVPGLKKDKELKVRCCLIKNVEVGFKLKFPQAVNSYPLCRRVFF